MGITILVGDGLTNSSILYKVITCFIFPNTSQVHIKKLASTARIILDIHQRGEEAK